MTFPRLTIRARLTLLYSGLFTACGAVVVAVSYTLVAQVGVATTGTLRHPSASRIGSFLSYCRSAPSAVDRNKALSAKCNAALQQLGAIHQHDAILSHLLVYSLVTLAVVIVLGGVLGWVFAGRALRPVHRITAAARQATEHNLSARVGLRGPHDELRELAETFDGMLDRLEGAFESQRRFIANASHELRTPLTVMRTSIDVVLGAPDSTTEDLRGMAADIRIAVDQAEQLLGSLFLLARNERGLTVHDEVDLAAVAEDVLDLAALGDRHVHADLEPAVILGDPVLIERLIANLIDNAVRYNSLGGDVWISTSTLDGESRLSVANTGPELSWTDAERIFRPFLRLSQRTTHTGYGLGLALVASIATIHGGTAMAYPRGNGGLSVTVRLPAYTGRCDHLLRAGAPST